jgi:hypothetical protein
MTFPIGPLVYTQGFGSLSLSLLTPHIDVRPPSPADGVNQQFPVGKIWVDTANFAVYILAGFQASNGMTQAHWELLTTAAGTIATITTDSGVVIPVAGNVNILGTANQISTSGSGSTATVSIPTTFITPGSAQVTTSLQVNGSTNLASLTQAGTLSLNATGGASSFIGSVAAGPIVMNSGGDVSIASTGGNLLLDTTGGSIQAGITSAAQTINIGTGPGVKTVTLGSTNTSSITTINAGSSGLILNPTALGPTQIGNSAGADVTIEAGADITIAAFGHHIFLSTGGTGDVVVEDANLQLSTNESQLQVKGNSPTDFIGTATLVSGVVTIANTNIAANDRIFIQRITANASTALGTLEYNITPGLTFNIVSVDPASPGTPVTADVSTVTYFIIRQLP